MMRKLPIAAAIFLAHAGQQARAAEADIVSPAYDPSGADQFQFARLGDTVPAEPAARRLWARSLAFDATLYGTVAVLEYRQIYTQAVDRQDPGFVGFNRFAHGRALAGPDYRPFKSPNADTLYSNAYLDLRDGPVLFEVPDTSGRYYTANFLDIYGNATNISTRTHGAGGGRYLIAPVGWQGTVPEGVTLFRVTTPIMWVLLRVLVDGPAGLRAAHALQDRFHLTGPATAPSATPAWPDGRDKSALGFFRILDFILRQCGHPKGEDALVYRYQALGLAGHRALDEIAADPEIRTGMEQGFAEARQVIEASTAQNGRRVGLWSEPVDIGRYGYNYLYRSSINTLGTGANVVDENYPFTTFLDADGKRLDGAKGTYELRLSPPPPARYFWSVTVYDAGTRTLHPNATGKYVIGDRTPGLVRDKDGGVTIRFQAKPVSGKGKTNWLPIPEGPFYVAIRAQGPEPDLFNGNWRPAAIRKTGSIGEAR